jgi:Helix-turn-helix domain
MKPNTLHRDAAILAQEAIADVRESDRARATPPSPLLTFQQAADYLRLSRSTIYTLLGRDLVRVKLAGRSYILRSSADDLIRRGCEPLAQSRRTSTRRRKAAKAEARP